MRLLLAIGKLILFLLTTFVLYSIILFGYPSSVFGFDKKGHTAKLTNLWGKASCYIFGLKISVKGKIPEPPFFLVSNHLSYIDVFVLFSALRCTFIAKQDLRKWPVVGFILATTGVMFVDRDRKKDLTQVNKEISQNLNTARGLILFPEGTTSDGTGILPFKSSLFHIPASNNWKVHCASISYATPGNEPHPTKSICWWDDTPFLTHFIRFLKVTKTYVTITFSSETVQNSNRKVVAKEAEVLIKNTFEPVHQI